MCNKAIKKINNQLKGKIKKIILSIFLTEHKYLKRTDMVHVMMVSNIGDMLFALGLIQALKDKTNKKTCLIIDEKREELTKLYPNIADEIILLNTKELKKYEKILLIKAGLTDYVYVVASGYYFVDYYKYISRNPEEHLFKTIQYCVFNLREINSFILPRKSMALNQKKCILLCPRSTSSRELPLVFWNKLAKRCEFLGLNVYTNACLGDVVVEGTKPISMSLVELYDFASPQLIVIGVRSGILDLLAFTEARVVAIYSEPEMKDFYSMELDIYRTIPKEYVYQMNDEYLVNEIINDILPM